MAGHCFCLREAIITVRNLPFSTISQKVIMHSSVRMNPGKYCRTFFLRMYLRDLKELLGKKDINMDLSNKSFPYSFKINEINGKK